MATIKTSIKRLYRYFLDSALHEGREYSVINDQEDVADNAYTKLFLNSHDTDLSIIVSEIRYQAEGRAKIEVYKNVSVDTQGTEAQPVAKKSGQVVQPAFDFYKGGDYSNLTDEKRVGLRRIQRSDQSADARAGSQDENVVTVGEEGDNILIRMQNTDGGEVDYQTITARIRQTRNNIFQ